jgi:hypothetical protein
VALINTYFIQNEVSHPGTFSIGTSPEGPQTRSRR